MTIQSNLIPLQSPALIKSEPGSSILIEHDLFLKTGLHPRIKSEAGLFAGHAVGKIVHRNVAARALRVYDFADAAGLRCAVPAPRCDDREIMRFIGEI